MRILDPALPLSNPRMAKMAAETIVCCGFNATRAARELRPDLKAHRNFAHRLMREPAVKKEIERIMEKPTRNPERFMELMWDWLEVDGTDLTKSQVEMKQTAARILAKGYVSDRKPDAPARPMHVDGLDEGMTSLTGEAKKVM